MLVTDKSDNAVVLRSRTTPVSSGDEAVDVIIALEREISRIGGCVGLAAPQIGILKSVAVIRHAGVSINLINPSIVSESSPFIYHGEGCKSLPGRIFSVPRFMQVSINNHILWPVASGGIPSQDNPNNKPLDWNNPPRGLHLSPTTAAYLYANAEECHGGIVCVAVQHEIDHLLGVMIDKKQGSVEQVAHRIVSENRVGRNDPCPCGSGKKFKKCCLSASGG